MSAIVRTIRRLTDEVFATLSPRFTRKYSDIRLRWPTSTASFLPRLSPV
jgi:hypothetical protein